MTQQSRYVAGSLIVVVLLGTGVAVVHWGLYGWTIFAVFPLLFGGMSTWSFRPHSQLRAAGLGALTATTPSLFFLLLGQEGLICILMCLPLTIPCGAIGGWLVYWLMSSLKPATGIAALLLLPVATLTWDGSAQPRVYKVQTEVIVAASPEQVWKHVISFPPLPEPQEWFFRAGVAYPQRARLEGTGPGAVRYCEFTTGAFVEPIEVWDEPRLLQFRVTENPAPLNELSPYGAITPKHLHGYMISRRGEFRLIPLPDGRTLLRGTTWYQHGLWPAGYWRLWSDAIIHRIHLRVLNHVKMLAEEGRVELGP